MSLYDILAEKNKRIAELETALCDVADRESPYCWCGLTPDKPCIPTWYCAQAAEVLKKTHS